MQNTNALLSVHNLSVNFHVRERELYAVRGVDLDLYEGECLAIVGESGCGKSVLCRTFSGMLERNGRIADGWILYRGLADGEVDLASLSPSVWPTLRGRHIATVFQDPMTSLNPVLTIGRQITSVILRHQGGSAREARARAIEMMRRVGIPDPEKRFDEYPFQYSGGMRQRIVIAIALCCRPRILICDEPTTALDVTIQAQILDLIRDLRMELGFSTVFITHDLGVVANVADRVGVMYAGQIVEIGTAEEIFYDPRHPYTWALLSSLPQLSVDGEPLYSLGGSPPSLYELPRGDAFAPRNPYALTIDAYLPPPTVHITDTHLVRSWLYDARAPRVACPETVAHLHERMVKEYGGAFRG